MRTETAIQTETWRQAIERGFDPSRHQRDPIPEGEWVGILQASIWGKSANLNCYFTCLGQTDMDDRPLDICKSTVGAGLCIDIIGTLVSPKAITNRYVLSVFWNRVEENAYTPRESSIKFNRQAISSVWRLKTGKNSKGKPKWISAEPLNFIVEEMQELIENYLSAQIF